MEPEDRQLLNDLLDAANAGLFKSMPESEPEPEPEPEHDIEGDGTLAALAKAGAEREADPRREQLRESVAQNLAINISRSANPWPEDATLSGHVSLLEAFAAHDKPRRPPGS